MLGEGDRVPKLNVLDDARKLVSTSACMLLSDIEKKLGVLVGHADEVFASLP